MSLGAYVARRLLHLVPIALGVTFLCLLPDPPRPGRPGADDPRQRRARPRALRCSATSSGSTGRCGCSTRSSWAGLSTATSASPCSTTSRPAISCCQRLPVTLWLIGFGALLAVLIAVPLAAARGELARPARPTTSCARVPLVGLGFPAFWVGIVLQLVLRPEPRTALPGRRLRERLHRTSAFDVPARADGRRGDRADPDPQPAREPARGTRLGLRDDRPLEGLTRAAGARPSRASQRDHLDRHRARRQHRLPRRRDAPDRAGLCAFRASAS